MADELWNAASHICQHLILRDMKRLVTHLQCISIIYFMKRNRYQHEIAKTCYQPLTLFFLVIASMAVLVCL